MNYRPDYPENPGKGLTMFVCGVRAIADRYLKQRWNLETEKIFVKKKRVPYKHSKPVSMTDCRHSSRMDFKGERALCPLCKKND